MAYVLHADVTDVDDLAGRLEAFAVANGWTLDDDSWPNNMSLHNGACYIHFRREVFNQNDANGINRQDNRMVFHLSTGYDGAQPTASLRFSGQPGSLVTATDDADLLRTNDLTGPFEAVHLFAPDTGPAYIYMVIETSKSAGDGFFSHVYFGEVDKMGMSYTPGGAWAGATFYQWYPAPIGGPGINDWSESGNIGTHHIMFGRDLSAGDNQVHVRMDGAMDGIPITRSRVCPLFTRHRDPDDPWTDSSSGGIMDGVFNVGANPVNGVTPLMPIPLIIARESDTTIFSVIGSAVDIRLCSMAGRTAGEEVTFGPDTWKLFPMRRNQPSGLITMPTSPAIDNTSGRYGFAIKLLDT